MSEQELQQRIRLELGRGSVRLWRNNVGALRDERGRLVTYGLCKGSSDLIGLSQVVIGPEHLGQTLAVFTALEVKTTKGRMREEQEKFLQLVQQLGGRAGVVRSMDDVLREPWVLRAQSTRRLRRARVRSTSSMFHSKGGLLTPAPAARKWSPARSTPSLRRRNRVLSLMRRASQASRVECEYAMERLGSPGSECRRTSGSQLMPERPICWMNG